MTPQLVVGIRSDDAASQDAVALGADLARLWGADLILNPLCCSCPEDEIHRWLLRVRAFENEVCLAMVNHAAPRENGLSMMIAPDGRIA